MRIGNRVTVGLGSVVLKDVDDNLIVAGVPAKPSNEVKRSDMSNQVEGGRKCTD